MALFTASCQLEKVHRLHVLFFDPGPVMTLQSTESLLVFFLIPRNRVLLEHFSSSACLSLKLGYYVKEVITVGMNWKVKLMCCCCCLPWLNSNTQAGIPRSF